MTDDFRNLDPEDAHRELQAEPRPALLDVRTPPEHDSHRLAGATLLPVQELQQRIGELDPEKNWFVYCEHGVRSLSACRFLAAQGFDNVTNISGGIAHWASRGLPFERGR